MKCNHEPDREIDDGVDAPFMRTILKDGTSYIYHVCKLCKCIYIDK